MINLDQSIAKVKEEIVPIDAPSDWVPTNREELIEVIMHEGAGRDRKTLLAWLNEQVELLPTEIDPVPEGKIGDGNELDPGAPLEVVTPKVSLKPIYRPVRRGGIWCLLDVANNELRQERFDNKGDARAFIGRLEQRGEGTFIKFHQRSE